MPLRKKRSKAIPPAAVLRALRNARKRLATARAARDRGMLRQACAVLRLRGYYELDDKLEAVAKEIK